MHACVHACTPAMVYLWRSEDSFVDSVLSFHIYGVLGSQLRTSGLCDFICPSFAETLFILISIGVTVAIAVVFPTSHLVFMELLVSHRAL